ncbi:MAG: glycosyltransferase family 2 protein [Pararhodobacter sp.]
MIAFQTRRTATFRCRIDFSLSEYGTVNFRDASGKRILLHLSLRRREGVVVINRHDASGWRREWPFAVPFDPEGCELAIAFGRYHATVRVDGRRLVTLSALPRPDRGGRFGLRRGFPQLAAIAYAEPLDGVDISSLKLEYPLYQDMPPGRGLRLTDRLEIEARRIDGVLVAEMPGLEAPLPLLPLRPAFVNGRAGATPRLQAAVVPGRVWLAADGAPGQALTFTVRDGTGTVLETLRLDRAGLIERLVRLAESGALEHDTLAALQAIEHVRHARLWAELPGAVHTAMLKAAAFFGLRDFLFAEPLADGSAPPAAPPENLYVTAPHDLSRARFAARMRLAPHEDPVALLQSLLADPVLDAYGRSHLVLGLSEWFATHGDPRALHVLAREGRIGPYGRERIAWQGSAALPFRYCDGDWSALAAELAALAAPQPGWLVTPAIGWVMQALGEAAPDGQGRRPDLRSRGAMIEAVLALLEGRGGEYWDRTACARLTSGAVALLVRGDTLPHALATRLEQVLLRVYALSPRFWSMLADAQITCGVTLSPRLRLAQEAFERLASLLNEAPPPPDRTRALADLLAQFQALGTFDAPRFRRELLGPAEVPVVPGALPLPSAIAASGSDPALALLRWMAFPAPARPALDTAQAALLADSARAVLPAIWDKVPVPPFAALMERLGRSGSALLMADAAPDPAALAALAQDMALLCTPEAEHLGLGVGLSLIAGLVRQGRADAAEPLMAALETACGQLDPVARQDLAAACAPAMALDVLRGLAQDSGLVVRAEALLTSPAAPAPARADLTADLRARANPLFDTLVCVYSCRPNLKDRIPAMRTGWLSRLDALGVPWLVMVGEGDGRREGDVVHLDAPDDYEGLPQKSLAMVRWVHGNTRFSRLLKIDDDCFLDPDIYFHGLAALAHDYHGRPLSRVRGQMDRSWHMAKSRSDRGRLELDKSPEPARYADGGSGYSLSRRAMAALIAAADSTEGQALARLSFMEDKLVGDLLAMRAIGVSGQGYRAAVLRRSRPGGPLVSQWENGFLPFAGAPIALAHLDGHERQAEVLQQAGQPWPHPAKIWPSYQPPRLGAQSNALDLLSDPARLAGIADAPVAVVAVLRNERFILPHFLAHYRKLGVGGFLIADNGSDDGTLDYLLDQPDVALFSVDTDYRRAHFGVAWQQALLSAFRVGRWSVVADADELLFWQLEQRQTLPELLAAPEFADADAARVFMLDMYPQGSLAQADFASGAPFDEAGFVEREPFLRTSGSLGPFTDAEVHTSALRHRLIPGQRAELFVAQKLALLKYQPWMRLSAGLHFVAETRPAARDLLFGHFKYNAAFRARAIAEVAREQHFNNAEEYRKYLALVSEGREVIHDPAHSVPWRDCAFVRRLCAPGG